VLELKKAGVVRSVGRKSRSLKTQWFVLNSTVEKVLMSRSKVKELNLVSYIVTCLPCKLVGGEE